MTASTVVAGIAAYLAVSFPTAVLVGKVIARMGDGSRSPIHAPAKVAEPARNADELADA